MRRLALLLALATGCGSLLETLPDGGGAGGGAAASGGGTAGPVDAGMICSLDNQCDCVPCTDVSQCLPGLGCNPAKHQGVSCGFTVCSSGGG